MAGVFITVEIGSDSDETTVLADNTLQWNGSTTGNPSVTVRVSFSDPSTYGNVFSDEEIGCGPLGPPPQP